MSLQSDHKQAIDNLTTLAIAEVVGVMELVKDEPLQDFAGSLRNTLPVIADEFSTAAQLLAVDYYDSSRTLANAPTPYTATLVDYDSATPVNSGIDYAVAKTYKEKPWETVLSLMAGNMQRVVAGADRENLSLNIVTDPDGTMYERVPSANACSFCLTMAAVAEVQRDQYFSRYHDFCRCVGRPIFVGQSPTELPIYSQVRSAYSLADKELNRRRKEVDYYSLKSRDAAKKWPDLTLTTKNHLRLVRQITGWK